MEEVDRYILARYGEVARQILKAYDEYDYSTIFQTVNAFMTVDLSAFYADISKDRLYTFAAGSKERRSAQTAMYVMTDGLARLLAPILSFTADELWRYLPGDPRRVGASRAVPACGRDRSAGRSRSARHAGSICCASATRVNASLELLQKGQADRQSLEAKVVASPPRARSSRCCSDTRRSCRCCSSCPRSTLERAAADGCAGLGIAVEPRVGRRSASAAGDTCRRCRPIRPSQASAIAARTRWRKPSRPDDIAFAAECPSSG